MPFGLAWARDGQLPVWYDAEYRLPLTAFGRRTGLEPRRADLVAWYLLEWRWLRRSNFRAPARARYEELARVHTEEYLESLGRRDALGRVFGVDSWDVPVDELMRSVRLACGGTVAAAAESLRRRGPAVNLSGGFHHAGPGHGAGLCAVNDIAVAVHALRHEGFAGRVAVLDLDAHPPDGTAACLRDDRLVWIGSLSGASTGHIPGVDETVLPPHCGDDDYLAALDALLGRMPPSDLAVVVAGGDVLANDHLGHLGLTLDGARRRDLAVANALSGVASIWLPGGGYHSDAWMVLAGTVMALAHGTSKPIKRTADPMAVRFARLARHLDRHLDKVAREISFDDVAAELGLGTNRRKDVLLGLYTPEALEYALYKYGVLGFLERRGYGQFRVEFGTASAEGERVMVVGNADGAEHLLIDCVMQKRAIGGADWLYIDWLTLRDPRARFGEKRQPLPGQDVPGLGLAREITGMLLISAQRLGTAGLAFTPAYFHTAYAARTGFTFLDPVMRGRFAAMLRDLGGMPLAEVSRAFSERRVLMNGASCAWEPSEMVSRVEGTFADQERADAEAATVGYTVRPVGVAPAAPA